MRALILVAGAALALSACSGGGSESEQNGVDTLAVDNLVVNGDGTALGADANMTMNGTTAIDPATGQPVTGSATDPATQNAVQQDLNTNAPDTNLANGL